MTIKTTLNASSIYVHQPHAPRYLPKIQHSTYVRVMRKLYKTFLIISLVSLFQINTTIINYPRNNTMGDNKSMTDTEISDLMSPTDYSKATRSTTNTAGTPSVSAK